MYYIPGPGMKIQPGFFLLNHVLKQDLGYTDRWADGQPKNMLKCNMHVMPPAPFFFGGGGGRGGPKRAENIKGLQTMHDGYDLISF